MNCNKRTAAPLLRIMASFLFATTLVVTALPAYGQFEFSPDHPDVRRMAEAGAEFLAVANPGERGQLILSALAIVECNKRYNNMIPTDHPLVQKAVNEILTAMSLPRSDFNSMLREDATYVPSLALILLCDVGDERYADQINALIGELQSRQHPDGGYCYLREPEHGDTSQIQYIGLALWVAHSHNFKVDLNVAKRCLEWLTDNCTPEGSWHYHYQATGVPARRSEKLTMSIHAAGSGTLYLLADFLQLVPRLRSNRSRAVVDSGLPPSVSIYVKPKSGQEEVQKEKKGPLVSFDTGKLNGVKNRCNRYWEANFKTDIGMWNYYYLYALERYAFFRERAEGSFKEVPNWYDQGVYHLMSKVQGDGGFVAGRSAPENRVVSTAFAVLYLVRSSEILILPSNSSRASGGEGFPENMRIDLAENGTVRVPGLVKGIDDVMKLLESGDVTDDQLEMIMDSMGPAIAEFTARDDASRNEKMAFLRGLVMDRNYYRRLIAVKLLAREQNLDNVPALLYALSDPDLRIRREAHNGLRLISRKIDSIRVPENATAADYDTAKKLWTEWYLSIRPDAQLIEDDQ